MNEQQLLAAAVSIRNIHERAVWLERECAGDAELLHRLQRRLALIELQELNRTDLPDQHTATTIFPGTAAGIDAQATDSAHDSTLREFAALNERYTLLERIGEGGMGEVWVAQQHIPVKRQVAVKFIRAGMDNRAVLARFEAERQALAVMDHPHIAKVLDGGTTIQQRPFVVMEYVRGIPLTEYCDRRKLSIRERLELFVLICDAVQHAHHKGVIHRDLKPSNVLVVEVDGRPIPKVIDFGLAKAMQGSAALTDRTLHTALGTVIGTPLYMAPEQLELDQLDVDTRSDLYSLGVMLYELITGVTPIDRARLRAAAWEEVRRIVREEEPSLPSARLSSSTSSLAVATQRQEQPASLVARVRGELDWIVMKALEKDRTRRYESARGFADDLKRYLVGEAVVAAPPSRLYRWRKWGSRHRALVSSIAAIATTLLLGSLGIAWQARIAIVERDDAIEARKGEAAQRRFADDQRARAVKAETEVRTRADELQLIVEFQARMLEQIDPVRSGKSLTREVQRRHETALGQSELSETLATERRTIFHDEWSRINTADLVRQLIADNLLAPAVQVVDEQFSDRPLLDARLRAALANQYFHLGLYDQAEQLLARVRDIRRENQGSRHPHTVKAVHNLATARHTQGRYAEAELLFREAVELSRELSGEADDSTLEALKNLAASLKEQGKLRDAEDCLRSALRIVNTQNPELSLRLAGVLAEQSRYSEAETLLSSVRDAARDDFARDDSLQVHISRTQGVLLQHQGRFAEAEHYLAETLAASGRRIGGEHATTLNDLLNFGIVLQNQRKLKEAETAFRDACETSERLAAAPPLRARALQELGSVLVDQNRFAEALPLIQQAYEICRRELGAEHLDTLRSQNSLGAAYWKLGRTGEAIPHLRAAWQGRRKGLDDQPKTCLSPRDRG